MKILTTTAILKQKPYLTKQELSLLWDKKDRKLDNKIQTLLNSNELISLKNGLYVTETYFQQQSRNIKYAEFIANILYYPSYLSLEYVLQKENIIPEAVYSYTSVTNKITRNYKNCLGNFSYRSIKPELFVGFQETNFNGNQCVKMATKIKALFDWLYLKTFTNPLKQELERDLRINWELFTHDDCVEFAKYAKLSKVKKMTQICDIISKEIL